MLVEALVLQHVTILLHIVTYIAWVELQLQSKFNFGEWHRGCGLVHLKGANSIAVSGLGCRNDLVDTGRSFWQKWS